MKEIRPDYFVGTAREINSLYRNLEKRDISIPLFSDRPVFVNGRFYGLKLNDGFMTVVGQTVIISDLLEEV